MVNNDDLAWKIQEEWIKPLSIEEANSFRKMERRELKLSKERKKKNES